jgi:hypothetical protein
VKWRNPWLFDVFFQIAGGQSLDISRLKNLLRESRLSINAFCPLWDSVIFLHYQLYSAFLPPNNVDILPIPLILLGYWSSFAEFSAPVSTNSRIPIFPSFHRISFILDFSEIISSFSVHALILPFVTCRTIHRRIVANSETVKLNLVSVERMIKRPGCRM